MGDDNFVWVISPLPNASQVDSAAGTMQSVMFKNKIDSSVLAASIKTLAHTITSSLDAIGNVGHNFELDEVELSALAGGDGSLTILAAEITGKLEGGIKLTFKRKKQPVTA